jgi:starch-binding outer membrane protein, SusD/RagB family
LQRGGYYLKPDLTMARESDYINYYQIARTYTAKLMSLKDRELTDFREVFMNQCKFITPKNHDMLFEVPFAETRGDVGWNIGITVVAGTHKYGGGNNYMAIPPTYFYSFDTLDVRRDVTCALYKVNTDFQEEFVGAGTGANSANISQGKWSRYFVPNPQGPSTSKGTGINWPMMRYADVLLMFAEAENEINGPTGEAQNALRRIRQRAFKAVDWPAKVDGYVASVSAGKDAFFKAIVNERAWEFGGEMIRKYELVRWGNYSQKMQETVQGLKNIADRAYDLARGAATVTPTDLPHYLFWKRDASGKFTTLNVNRAIPNSRHTALELAGWTKTTFMLYMHDDALTYKEWVTRNWENYTNGTVRYIFPIPAAEIATGVLKNDGYGFGG